VTEREKAIAIFDSGFGGLTIMRQVIKTLPAENIVYFGDSLNAPYGDKSKLEIIRLTKEAVSFLRKKEIKALIIACNTVSVYAYKEIFPSFDLPIIDMISPSLKMVLNHSKDKKIGIIATKATIYSQVYRREILAHNPAAKIYSLACPSFVPMIEEGEFENEKACERIKKALFPLIKQRPDLLLLACTHFPLIKEKIKEAIGEGTEILDPSISISLELQNFLKKGELVANNGLTGSYEFYTSGNTNNFKTMVEKILGIKIDKVKKKE
jgi:glutamate racemase